MLDAGVGCLLPIDDEHWNVGLLKHVGESVEGEGCLWQGSEPVLPVTIGQPPAESLARGGLEASVDCDERPCSVTELVLSRQSLPRVADGRGLGIGAPQFTAHQRLAHGILGASGLAVPERLAASVVNREGGLVVVMGRAVTIPATFAVASGSATLQRGAEFSGGH